MRRTLARIGWIAVASSALALGLAVTPAAATGKDASQAERPARAEHPHFVPVVFLHGFVGSGSQFETQAERFASNGYPHNFIATQEYDSSFSTETHNDVFTALDQTIAALKRSTGARKIDLVGHSLGTALSQEYLSSPTRAANIAKYVNIDGAIASSPPGGVPTLAIWARTHEALSIGGATNVHFPNQTHVQSATSAETFEQMYIFFNGTRPDTTNVVRQRGRITLAGRAQIFPQNTGVVGTLQIFEVNATTGRRIGKRPKATFALSGDGSWGPFTARAGAHYEFAIVRTGAATHHLYYEPFLRSDYWIHLLTSPPTGGIGGLFTRSDRSTDVTIVRYKEFWGDQGANNDVLTINGVSAINAANSPIATQVNAIAVEDQGSDGVTNLATPIPTFALPFFTGVDIFIPASTPPHDTVRLVLTPRLGGGRVERINIPNWASSNDFVSVQFRDFVNTGHRRHER